MAIDCRLYVQCLDSSPPPRSLNTEPDTTPPSHATGVCSLNAAASNHNNNSAPVPMADKETGNTEPSKAVSSMTNVRIQLLLTHITFTGLVILNSCLINLSFYFGKSEAILALM
jgi:hypothetical protein